MFGLNAWQFLLYIAALEMIMAPFFIALFNGYYRAKYNARLGLIGTICKAIGTVLDKATEKLQEKTQQ